MLPTSPPRASKRKGDGGHRKEMEAAGGAALAPRGAKRQSKQPVRNDSASPQPLSKRTLRSTKESARVTFKTPDPSAKAPASPASIGPSILRPNPRGILKSSPPSFNPPARFRLLPRTTRMRPKSEAETPSSFLDTQKAATQGDQQDHTIDTPNTTGLKVLHRSKPDARLEPLPIMNSVNDKSIADTMDRMRGYLEDRDQDFQKIRSSISKGIVKGFKSSFGNRYNGRCTEEERKQYIALWVKLAVRHNSRLTSEQQEFLIKIPKEGKKDNEVIVVDSSDSGA